MALGLYVDSRGTTPAEPVEMPPVVVSVGEIVRSAPRRLWLINRGQVPITNLVVTPGGDGAGLAQVAVDLAGVPGVWAAAGFGIVLVDQLLAPGGSMPFWVRSVFTQNDEVGRIYFELLVDFSEVTDRV